MTVNFRGYVFQDDGDAVSGATVQLLETGTTTVEASTTTDSDGLWYFAESDQDRYDVKITSGTSVRYIRWDDQVSFKELDVRNNTGNTTPAATFSNITNNAANQVAVFSGANSTKADNDEIYLSFKMHDSAGNLDEFARMTVVATDVSTTTEDGQIEFDVMKAGTLTKVWTITSSTGAAMSFDMNVDALTIGSGADTDVSLTFDANSADGVITWMEDEDYFKFSDDILMNSTERINFYDTAIYIYSSTDGQLDLVADTEIQIAATTVDLNGNLDVSGTYTGAGLMTTGGNIVIPDAGNIGSASDTDAIAISSGGVVTMNQIPVFSAGINVSGGTIAGTLATAAQGNVTSLGTLTTLTVDNIITNGTNIGHTSDTDLMTLADGVLTIAGELDAATLDISGNADIDGTTNLDAVDIDGAVQIDATFTSGVDGQGYDTKFFGDTSGAYILWDTSADKLLTAGGAVVDIVKDKLLIGGTAVTTTAAELNVLDAVTAGTVSASLGVVVDSNKDIGSFRNITLTGELDAGSLDVSGNADIDGTLEADVITIDGTNVVTGSLITTLGTISAGVWQGTAIASGYIAADAITGAKIADDAIDSEHYTDGSIDNAHIADDAIDSEHYAAASIDFAHIQNVAANSILGRDANSSGVLSEVALATTQILIGDGTGFTAAALSGDATMTNAGVVSLAAAQTNVTSLLATDIKIGEDDQTKIDFETADEIHLYAANVEQVYVADNIFGPQSDSDVDLGTTGVRWKDAFVDSITVTGEVDGASLDISGNADIDGTTNLDNTDIDGTLVVDGSNISLDSTSTFNIDNSNTSNGVTIATATSGVPISIGHTTSRTTINDDLTVTGDIDMGSAGSITNVGHSSNDWTSTALTVKGYIEQVATYEYQTIKISGSDPHMFKVLDQKNGVADNTSDDLFKITSIISQSTMFTGYVDYVVMSGYQETIEAGRFLITGGRRWASGNAVVQIEKVYSDTADARGGGETITVSLAGTVSGATDAANDITFAMTVDTQHGNTWNLKYDATIFGGYAAGGSSAEMITVTRL